MSRTVFRAQGPRFCPIDGYALEFGTDGHGQATSHCPACNRRRAGRCMDCGAPVRGRAWRCERHRELASKRASRASDIRNQEGRNAAERARYQRRRREDPEAHRRSLERKRAWREANRARVKLHKRRGRLAGTNGYSTREKYLEYQNDYNAARREKKRQQELARYYRLHPERPDPRCVECGSPIPWTPGKGRPAKRCALHNPWRRKAAAPAEVAA